MKKGNSLKFRIIPYNLKYLVVISILLIATIGAFIFDENNDQDVFADQFESNSLAEEHTRNISLFPDNVVQGELAFQKDVSNTLAHFERVNEIIDNESLSSILMEDVFASSPLNFDEDTFSGLEVPEGCEISTDYEFELQLFEFINHERERIGVEPLSWDEDLSNAARKHAVDMACNDFFSHTNPDGETFDERIAAEGYVYSAVGENLYAGEDTFNNPQQAYYGWYNSTAHYKVMIHPELTEVGIGYVYSADSRYGGYFTADFGTPQD